MARGKVTQPSHLTEKHKKTKKDIDTINKMCYNIIVKRNGKEQNKKIKKVLKKS